MLGSAALPGSHSSAPPLVCSALTSSLEPPDEISLRVALQNLNCCNSPIPVRHRVLDECVMAHPNLHSTCRWTGLNRQQGKSWSASQCRLVVRSRLILIVVRHSRPATPEHCRGSGRRKCPAQEFQCAALHRQVPGLGLLLLCNCLGPTSGASLCSGRRPRRVQAALLGDILPSTLSRLATAICGHGTLATQWVSSGELLGRPSSASHHTENWPLNRISGFAYT